MQLSCFKNTVFPITIGFVLILISCGNTRKTDAQILNKEQEKTDQVSKYKINESLPIVAANRTKLYLPKLKGKQVGVVANQTSVIFKNGNTHTHLVDSLLSLEVDVKKVFAPEHGFRGRADAGEHVEDGIDTKTGTPIISLHGKHRKPTQESLRGLDVIVFDIQDVGVRFYTYISTLHNVMEACAEASIPVIILDRPNPNGHYVDGPTLEMENKSFLGMHPIPLVHGMTIGEYAQMINGEKWLENGIQCTISIIGMKNYTHNTSYSLPIRPSPNLPNDQSISLYPSLGLFEGTNINAGRGTEFQFQIFGAPFLNQESMKFTYIPEANFGSKNPKHKGKLCYGKDLRTNELQREMTLKWVIEAYNNCNYKSLFFNTKNFTKHAGTPLLQKQIEAGLSEADIRASWQEGLQAFVKTRSKYLLYN